MQSDWDKLPGRVTSLPVRLPEQGWNGLKAQTGLRPAAWGTGLRAGMCRWDRVER
jgi:hypothetical protein